MVFGGVFDGPHKLCLKPSRIGFGSNGLQMFLRRASDDGFRNPWELLGSFSLNDPDLLKELEIGF